MKKTLIGVALAAFMGTVAIAEAPKAAYRPEAWNLAARERFAAHRYGIFIVWGLYANYAQGEWYLHQGKLDREAYERMIDGFYPSKYDAREWARIFKRSGAKYVTITARHHDGFAIWPSKVDSFNIGSTPFKRDVLKELNDALKAEGIELSLYYSLLDWHRMDYTPGRAYLPRPSNRVGLKSDYASYKRYMMGQITELLDTYHPINIWFDGEWDHMDKDRGGTFDWGFDEIFDLIHSRHALVLNNNHRAPRPKEDIQAFERDLPGEGTLFSRGQKLLADRPIEQCDVIQKNVWGYRIGEEDFRTPEDCVALIVRAAAKNANLLLNIGPDGSGRIPRRAVEVFDGIGKWFDKNGESVYGTTAGGVKFGNKVVTTRKGDTLYVHFLDPEVKDFTFLLGGVKQVVKCPVRAAGDVSDVVVKVALGGQTPEQYVVPGSKPTWKIVTESCPAPRNAAEAIDGNPVSMWHSHPEPYDKNTPFPPPQSFTVDCGVERTINGFIYTPRCDGCKDGLVDVCEFYVSTDNIHWTRALEGRFPDLKTKTSPRRLLLAQPVKARYFRFVARHALPKNDRVAIGEVDLW